MRIFQTFVLPDHLVAKYKLSFAAANFSHNLISGGGFDKCYSLIPVNVNGELPYVESVGYEVVYSNWRKKGSLLAKLAIFKEQYFLFKQVRKYDSLWLYNLNVMNALLFVLIKLFKSTVKLNVIILDFTPTNSWKKQDYWYLKLLNKADGTICLANSDLFKCRNTVVLPGVVPFSAGNEPLIVNLNNKFLLSGVLNEEIAQITMILETFSQLPHCELHITGKTDNEFMIKEYATKHSNIIWHGSVPFQEYLDILHDCTFVLSTRDPKYPENQCNFPSKIIESLLHNRIIVSTIYYPQLRGIKYFQIKSDPKLFMRQLSELSTKSSSLLLEFANQGQIVIKLFSPKVWNQMMIKIDGI